MTLYSKSLIIMVVFSGVCTVSATWQNLEESGCVGEQCEGESEEKNNKFALLFRQILARHRETNMDCGLIEEDECPEGTECVGGKCRSMGARRTKMINLYSRW